jgi:cytochrome c553
MENVMMRHRVALAAMASLVVVLVLLGGCSSGSSTALPNDGAALVAAACTKCHPATRYEAVKKDRTGWTGTVTRMQTHGLQVTDAEKQTIIDYLTKRDGGS